MKRMVFIVLTVAMLVVLTCAAALAAPPVTDSADLPGVFPIQPCGDPTDPDFLVMWDGIESVSGIRHDNGDGTFRWVIKNNGQGVLKNSITGKSLPAAIRANYQVHTSTGDFPPDVMFAHNITVQYTGWMKVTGPGGGDIYIDVGRLLLDYTTWPPTVLSASGQMHPFTRPFSAELCAALE